jgi:pimeloyl-ACP methyl ester carboxylesterase
MPILHFAAALLLVADSTSVRRIALAPAESIAVTVTGEGTPVVLIPGLFGSAFGFRRVTTLLRDSGYQAIVVEPLGIGNSSRPGQADYSLSAQARRIAAVLDSMKIHDVILVAHSIGAGMAFRLVTQRPDLIVGLVSLDGAAREEAATAGVRKVLKFATLLKIFGGGGLIRKKVKEGMIQDAFDPSWVTDSVVAGYTAGASRDLGATIRVFQGMARATEAEPVTPKLADIKCPVVLLTGAENRPNRILPVERQLLLDRLPSIRIDSIPRSGQYLHEERPDAVLAAVRSIQLRVAARDPR